MKNQRSIGKYALVPLLAAGAHTAQADTQFQPYGYINP